MRSNLKKRFEFIGFRLENGIKIVWATLKLKVLILKFKTLKIRAEWKMRFKH